MMVFIGWRVPLGKLISFSLWVGFILAIGGYLAGIYFLGLFGR